MRIVNDSPVLKKRSSAGVRPNLFRVVQPMIDSTKEFKPRERGELGAAMSRNQNAREDKKIGDRKMLLPGQERMDESFTVPHF